MEAATSATQYTQQEHELFQQVDNYPWANDNEFQMGLRSILGGNPPSPQTADIELRARCFFFQRKAGQQIDFQRYKTWHYAQAVQASSSASNTEPQSIVDDAATGATDSTANGDVPLADILARASRNGAAAINSGPDDGGAKFSYAEIVEMIQNGKEIPGIKQIPETVLAGQGSSSAQTRRKKPWEKDESEEQVGGEAVAT